MTTTTARPSERTSKFMRDALLAPEQTHDVVLTPNDLAPGTGDGNQDRVVHAHSDFGHGDFGHSDFGHADFGHADA